MIISSWTKAVIFGVSLWVALGSCATTRPAHPLEGESALTPEAVQRDPNRYDGQVVTVRGVLLLGTNSRGIFQSTDLLRETREAWEHRGPVPEHYRLYCLTLMESPILNSHWQDREALVVVTGTFRAHYLDDTRIDVRACGNEGALEISSIQRARSRE